MPSLNQHDNKCSCDVQDWALFQTSDPRSDNYVSAEHVPGPLLSGQDAATVQGLSVRFDQKGHERPFQKAVIVDVVDGYLNPGDKIIIRLGDRRFGARGTRVQTFVEKEFLMRWYIDPIGTSRFAAIKPDIAIPIVPGEIHHLKITTPRLCKPGVTVPIYTHSEDLWGNTTCDIQDLQAFLTLTREGNINSEDAIVTDCLNVASSGWSYANFESISIPVAGEYIVHIRYVRESTGKEWTATEYLTVDDSSPVPRVLFADLHVHSDDTVGTNDSKYNFSYAQFIAGLDIVGYTANDFNITASRWTSTLELIAQINEANPGRLLIFPGTEWCGNSAVGGDHNVIFLGDPSAGPYQFPFDKHGNVARSFEWNADMSNEAELVPGAWPLDEVYATYAPDAENHLMIPHVGGRRCNLAWHHPRLDRLVEIGSAWGHFEWLIKDAIARGWKVGVCANSDEHRGRCGGGVPGTAVFGTKGGVTGVLCDALERAEVGRALRARHTFATTGERLIGILKTKDGEALQGDEIEVEKNAPLSLTYDLLGSTGFFSVEAFDATGCIYRRNLWSEGKLESGKKIMRVTWGGSRVYDRYKEVEWKGSIFVEGDNCKILNVQPFGGLAYSPEDQVHQVDTRTVSFHTRTSGDFDGLNLHFDSDDCLPRNVRIDAKLGGYVKIGDALAGNPYKPHPKVTVDASLDETSIAGGKTLSIGGGAELFMRVELIPEMDLPRRVQGKFEVPRLGTEANRSVFVVGREWDGGKVVTSPIFIKYR